MPAAISMRRAAFWILCLSCLAVGARNFETGIAVDANTYGRLAREIARSGEWFRMAGTTPELTPFAEHPHLGIWIVAAVFKVLPAADWSGRIPGHVFYFGFLLVFFWLVRRKNSEATAVVAVLLLWAWARFSNFFSNIYLDPACAFFGLAAIACWDHAWDRGRVRWAALAGACLAASAMSKGLTALGFLPGVAWIGLTRARSQPPKTWAALGGAFALGCGGVLAVYYWAVRQSAVPEFFEIYFHRQWAARFAQTWDWSRLFYGPFWPALIRDTSYLAFFALVGLARRPRWQEGLPWVLLLTFACLYAPAGRHGANYWVVVMPWVAWLAAAGITSLVAVSSAGWVRWTSVFAIFAVVVIQYLPVRTHGSPPQPELVAIEWLKQSGRAQRLLVDATPRRVDFTHTDNLSWYTDLPLTYAEKSGTLPRAVAGEKTVLVVLHPSAEKDRLTQSQGWCRYDQYRGRSLWLACP